MTASIYYICVDATDYRIVEMNSLAQVWHKITQAEVDERRPTLLDFQYPANDRVLRCIDEAHRTQEPVDFSYNIEEDYVAGLWKVEFHPSPRNPDHVQWFAASLNDVVDAVLEGFGSKPDSDSAQDDLEPDIAGEGSV